MDREHFNLNSLELRNDGGIKAVFTTQRVESETVDDNERNSHIVPHPDIRIPFEKAEVVIFNYLGYKQILEEAAQTGKAAKKWSIDMKMELEDRVSCHKITLVGKDEKKVIICSGKLKVDETKTAINTPRRSVSAVMGVDMSDAVVQLEDEAFAYLYEGKKAQTDMNDELG